MIKSAQDLITKCPSGNFKKFHQPAKDIKKLTKDFNEKMVRLAAEGYDEKKLLNAQKESKKLKDLAFLKDQNPPGPFSCVKDIKDFIQHPNSEEEKNKRIYVEVRYALVTSTTLKENAAVFRLKRNGKNLSTEEYTDNLMSVKIQMMKLASIMSIKIQMLRVKIMLINILMLQKC